MFYKMDFKNQTSSLYCFKVDPDVSSTGSLLFNLLEFVTNLKKNMLGNFEHENVMCDGRKYTKNKKMFKARCKMYK